jgi:hypothetical protein
VDLLVDAESRVVVDEAAADSGATQAALFPVGDHAVHEAHGDGVVRRVEADTVAVLFASVGYDVLAMCLVLERTLLRPA